jgi:serine/threonine protein kinase
MESLPAYQSLKTVLESGPIQPGKVLTILKNLASALASIHGQGQAHQKLCPANISLSPDFEVLSLSATANQGIAYLAPEQHKQENPSPHSDVYCIGIILFEMVTGTLPEGGERPSDRNADLPPWIDGLFDHCYAPRSRRLQNASDVHRWLLERAGKTSFEPGMEVGTVVEATSSQAVKVALPAPNLDISPNPHPQNSRLRVRAVGALVAAGCFSIGLGIAVFTGGDLEHLSGHVGGRFTYQSAPWQSYREALAFYSQGRYDESKTILDPLLKNNKGFSQAYHLRGNVQTELGKMTTALSDYQFAIQLNPSNPQIYLDRGNTYMYLKKPESAIQDFMRYLKLQPDATNSGQVRGWIYELKNRL